MHLRFDSACTWLVMLLAIASVRADDWPQWRGPGRDGVWHETGIIEKFDKPQLDVSWRAEIGGGYSGPTVAGGRVYVMDLALEPVQQERILCFDAANGEKLWSFAYDCEYRNISYTEGPRASVTIDEGRAYALGTMGHLHCLDAVSGALIWSRDLNDLYNIRMPVWGIAGSPLVEGDAVIVQIGGEGDACMVALDKRTGAERWTALEDEPSYSSPIAIDQAGKRVVVGWTGQRVAGLDAETGKLYWDAPFPPTLWIIGIATPVVENDWLFVSSCNDGSLMLRLDRDRPAVTRAWQRKGADERQTDALHALISTPYLAGDYVYGVDSYAELRCLDARTGDRLWESVDALPKLRYGTVHMVRNGERIWMFNERGELIISKLSPAGFEEISRAQLIEPTTRIRFRRDSGVCWAHPAFAYRHVFARNDEELVCASLAAD